MSGFAVNLTDKSNTLDRWIKNWKQASIQGALKLGTMKIDFNPDGKLCASILSIQNLARQAIEVEIQILIFYFHFLEKNIEKKFIIRSKRGLVGEKLINHI